MPYIGQAERPTFDAWIDRMELPFNKGQLEYVVARIATRFLKERTAARYADRHDVTYALMHAADEFRRRMLDPYEDLKKGDNGDVYGTPG